MFWLLFGEAIPGRDMLNGLRAQEVCGAVHVDPDRLAGSEFGFGGHSGQYGRGFVGVQCEGDERVVAVELVVQHGRGGGGGRGGGLQQELFGPDQQPV